MKKLVLDVLKPIKGRTIISIADRLANLDGITTVNISVTDMDVETMGLSILIEGENIVFDKIAEVLEEEGCAIHSIDQVISQGTRGK